MQLRLCFTFATLEYSRQQLLLQVKAQDILGSMKADKQNLRVEELDLLFQPPNFNTVQ